MLHDFFLYNIRQHRSQEILPDSCSCPGDRERFLMVPSSQPAFQLQVVVVGRLDGERRPTRLVSFRITCRGYRSPCPTSMTLISAGISLNLKGGVALLTVKSCRILDQVRLQVLDLVLDPEDPTCRVLTKVRVAIVELGERILKILLTVLAIKLLGLDQRGGRAMATHFLKALLLH